MTTLVVISHYNAWPADQLVALLDQAASVPAGANFALCVVVNQAEPTELVLPERQRHVPVLHRANTGYNIGAWDHGWRANPGHDCYLFLQEECRIVRPGWVAAHRRLAMMPAIGLVGEAMQWAGRSWKRLRWEYRDAMFEHPLAEGPVPYPVGIQAGLRDAGLAEGRTGAHLQSLVLCARRTVLEAIDGFPIGATYGEAVVAEVTISKRVEALGLKVREVGPGSFRYVLHPQWIGRQGLRQAAGRIILRNLPARLAERAPRQDGLGRDRPPKADQGKCPESGWSPPGHRAQLAAKGSWG